MADGPPDDVDDDATRNVSRVGAGPDAEGDVGELFRYEPPAPAANADSLRAALLELALSRLADSDEETPDAEAQDDADEVLSHLDGPAFEALLKELSGD